MHVYIIYVFLVETVATGLAAFLKGPAVVCQMNRYCGGRSSCSTSSQTPHQQPGFRVHLCVQWGPCRTELKHCRHVH